MDIKVLVATHKKYKMPSDDMYLPVFCGAATSKLDLPYQRDDEGINISIKNDTYCELTAVYWAYKNLRTDYIGINHYRRYFKFDNKIISKNELEQFLNESPIILPKKRNYYIETAYTQYIHAHGSKSIDTAREVISKHYPGYLKSFDMAMSKRSLHIYNMFIMREDIFHDYCDFLFDVLFKVEELIEPSDRIFGYLGERLLDVYLIAHKNSYIELPVINEEPINWPSKIINFIKRKVTYVD